MRGVRRELKRERPDVALLAARAFAASGFATPGVAAVYNAQGSELDAWPLAEVLRAAGAALALPVATALDAPLLFRQVRDGDLSAPDVAGVPAPAANAPVLRPALLVVPSWPSTASAGGWGRGAATTTARSPPCAPPGRP